MCQVYPLSGVTDLPASPRFLELHLKAILPYSPLPPHRDETSVPHVTRR